VPTRRCVGCGKSKPQTELVRFAAEDGVLVAGRTAPGRGAWTCRNAACFEQAVARRAFQRALRQNVRIEPTLYTEELHGERR
jgi:predicted RNA-binding protein YlxR (DUF448 family)